MSDIYDPLKLSEFRKLFLNKRALIVGAGAVGVAATEFLIKMCMSVDLLDFDRFDEKNAAKHSCLVRTPEDVGKNKARAVAERAKPYLADGCTANGVDGAVEGIGPEALADYDFVVSCVDNYEAKILLGEVLMTLPPERRPRLIVAGTHGEMAKSTITDGEKFCVRCLVDESWIPAGHVRTSCTGAQVRVIDGEEQIVRTSNLASSLAAHWIAEQIRDCVIGNHKLENAQITYHASPAFGLGVTYPKKKDGCPGCARKSDGDVRFLKGNVPETTLGEALEQIESMVGDDVQLAVHTLNLSGVSYGGFIHTERCAFCGASILVDRHEGRVNADDLVCDVCREGGFARTTRGSEDVRRAFTNKDEVFLKKTLYELGYPIGAHLYARRGAGFRAKESVFAMADDHLLLRKIDKL